MEKLRFSYKIEPISYKDRLRQSILGVLFFCIVISVGAFVISKNSNVIYFGLGISIFYCLEALKKIRYYVYFIAVDEKNMYLHYLDKDSRHEIEIPLENVIARKVFIWYKVRPPVPYLSLKLNDGRHIKQYFSVDWDKSKIESAAAAFNFSKAK